MATSAAAGKIPHALLVPASAQGHLNSCVLLASSLASLGFQVSFVYFSSEYAKLKAKKQLVVPVSTPVGADAGDHTTPTSPGSGSGSIHIHVVQDGFAPGDIDKVFFVTAAMKENLFNLILELQEQGKPLTCLISDPLAYWTVDVAERAGVPLVNYLTSNAMSYLLLHDIALLFSQGIFPEKGSPTQWKRETPLMLDHIPGLPPFSSELYPKEVRFGDVSSPVVSVLHKASVCVKHGERLLIHTMLELEPDAFHALQVLQIPAYAIGPLRHHTKKQDGPIASSQSKENLGQLGVLQLNEDIDCISWLNTQAESSVIYIAFGSHVSLSVEEIQELAFGLEASGNPFLWAIRGDSHGGGELSQVLPNGFLDRVSGKGMITSWAPQMEVLAHTAVGGFLTHCGWNSAFESLWEGVPMLCCPCLLDQRLNSHYICDVWGVGLELGRTDTGGLERRYVELGVKGLMQEEEGMKARGKAKEVMQLARKTCLQGGQSFSNLQKFYEDMKVLCL